MKGKTLFKLFLCFIGLSIILGSVGLFLTIVYYSKDLPNYKKLEDYDPPITTRLYSSDGKFLKEYAKEKRLFVPIDQIPDLVKYAFISAEDASFYDNSGISPKSILSAVINNVLAKITGRNNLRGGSTITQQVAKNFLLTNEKTLSRKVKEAILSIRMTQNFSKDQILELYLNQIFLGNRSYGVASAALNYFNKSLDQLTIEEVALLASLPKAPAKLDPTRNDQSDVLSRRNWIIDRMDALNYIKHDDAEFAKNQPIRSAEKSIEEVSNGEFFSEEVRKELVNMYGEENLLEGGNVVNTTIDPRLQRIADKYLKSGIEDYDVKHGFRGAIGNIAADANFKSNWSDLINNFKIDKKYRSDWEKAVVLGIDDNTNTVSIGLKKIKYEDYKGDKSEENNFVKTSNDDELVITGYIPLKNLIWARKYITVDQLGPEIKTVSDVSLKVGDVIVVQAESGVSGSYYLKQIPNINGALLAMDPNTGKVLAMMGGYIDSQIDFNRAIQAERQPGSVLKTFAYLAALENGYTPASIVIDEEIELNQGPNRPPYKPKNFTPKFYGPTTLRVGLEQSRNVTTVRMASDVGLSKVTEVIKRFGINERPRKIYSIVLGSTETTLLKIVRAYSMIVNGGKYIDPAFIEKIQDKEGKIIYKRNNFVCDNCKVDGVIDVGEITIPIIPDTRKSVTDSATAFQITNMLEGVVQRGTAWKAKAIGKPIGAKTGTTNDSYDAWFVGFSPDLVVGVYLGFDRPSTLGNNQTGGAIAAPIFVDFMKEALQNKPSTPFRIPPTVNLIKIDTKTGYYPTPFSNQSDVVLEAFKDGDKIVKFDNDVSDEDLDEFVESQDAGERDRPEITNSTGNNVQGNVYRDENYIKEFNEMGYEEDASVDGALPNEDSSNVKLNEETTENSSGNLNEGKIEKVYKISND